jgi:transcription elongation factor SPT4
MSYRRDEEVDDDEEEDDVPTQIDELARASVPTNMKTIRACKRCGILKTQEQFYDYGCENCPFLEMVDNMERVNGCTTAFFEGQAAIMDPRESWAAKWMRTDNFLPGTVQKCIDCCVDVTGCDPGISNCCLFPNLYLKFFNLRRCVCHPSNRPIRPRN